MIEYAKRLESEITKNCEQSTQEADRCESIAQLNAHTSAHANECGQEAQEEHKPTNLCVLTG